MKELWQKTNQELQQSLAHSHFQQHFLSLVMTGGKGTRLDPARKKITALQYPMLKEHDGIIGPKGMALMTCASSNTSLPMIEWHLKLHEKTTACDNIVLGLGHGSQLIQEYFSATMHSIPYSYLVEEHPAGTLAPLVLLHQTQGLPDTPILMANGDNLLTCDFDKAFTIAQILAQQQQQDNTDDVDVVVVASLVPWEESESYGTLDMDMDTGKVTAFKEKSPKEENTFVTIAGDKKSPINSGFSFILHPKRFFERYVSQQTIELVSELLQGKLPYKEYEKFVKYETIYETVANKEKLLALYTDAYWTDLGTEEKIKAAEKHLFTLR